MSLIGTLAKTAVNAALREALRQSPGSRSRRRRTTAKKGLGGIVTRILMQALTRRR